MKKVSLWFLISLCLIILISFIDYYRYSKVINDFVGSVFSEVSNKYPDVNSEDLIKIVNGSNNGKSDILKKYGFTNSDINYLSKMNDSFYKNIVINVIVYLLSLIDYNGIVNNFANYYLYVQNGEYYRLITSMFVHANILHLVSNMYALYVVGPIIEKYYGKGKFLLIYLGSGIIGSLFSVVLTNYASVGASGAIFGLFGALLYFGYKYRATLDGFLRSSIIPTLLVNLLLGFMIPGIDVSAHLGGLIGGLLFSYQTGVVNKEKTKDKINGLIIIMILVAFLIFMLIKKAMKKAI